MIIKTDRLILRPFTTDDFDAVHAYASDPETVKYTLWGPNSEFDTQKFIDDNIENWNSTLQHHFGFAITLKENGKLIGGCEINLVDEFNMLSDEIASIGFILNKSYQKNGYATEAAKALIDFGFNKLKLHRIFAKCNAENIDSIKVMEKAGMTKEAHFKSARFGRVGNEQKWYDEVVYAILNRQKELT